MIFLDIGQRRIQTYLDRSPDLAGRRGASNAISLATRPRQIDRALERKGLAQCAWTNGAAGEADGTISLVVHDKEDVDAVTNTVFNWLRQQLPAAEFAAVTGQGESYIEAYRDEIKPRLATGQVTLSLPPVVDLPLLRRCEACRTDAALATRTRHGERLRLCLDCATRVSLSRYRSVHEKTLMERTRATQRADDFAALADLGIDPKRNHLATIYADGNRFGSFFEELAASDHPKDEISPALNRACVESLVAASKATMGKAKTDVLPVIPHVVGGDDVLVSVPASLGWTFATGYLTAYCDDVASVVAEVDNALVAPTASAAVVFHHQSLPFGRVRAVADDLLRRAKAHYNGDEASIAWLDATREGGRADAASRPWRLRDLHPDAREFEDIFILKLLADRSESRFRSILELAASGDWPGLQRLAARDQDVGFLLLGRTEADLELLARLGDTARWWRWAI